MAEADPLPTLEGARSEDAVLDLISPWVPRGQEVGSLIGGEVVPGRGEEIELVDPSTGTPFLRYRDAGPDVAAEAMAAAAAGFRAWTALTPSERGRRLWAVGAKVRAQGERLARLETLSAGKPIRDTRVEVAKVAEMMEYWAGWADKIHGDVIPVPTTHLNYTRREPYGPVVQITPWNAPIFTGGWQLAPALATGNAPVLKPSELTPLTSLILGFLTVEAGIPANAVTILLGHGHTTGAAAIAHKANRLVVFVGSPATGARIAEQAARNVIPCVLELGGKSANIVFEDADLKLACLGSQAAIFSAAGQSCVAGSRLLVHRPVYERMTAMVAEGAGRIPVGDPRSEATQIGPIATARQYAQVGGMVEAGLAAGATALTGGGAPAGLSAPEGGFYFAPTVLSDVTPAMEIAREEVFGPVLAALVFDEEEEAIALANDSRFGLAGAVWTKDPARAHRVAAQVEAGTFWINGYKTISTMSPFGGFKGSGYGRSSGREAIEAYTRTKSVWVETAAQPATPFGYAPE